MGTTGKNVVKNPVAKIWPIQKDAKDDEKWLKPCHLRVLGESFIKNTNMTGFRWFSKMLA